MKKPSIRRAIAAGGDCVLTTDCVVVANGARARCFSALEWLPVEAVRGQLTRVAQTERSRRMTCGISANRYVTPAINGYHIVGASYQRDGASTELACADQADNIDRINRLLHLGMDPHGRLDGRVAFRAVSDDRVPVVGCVPDRVGFERQYRDIHHGRGSQHYPAGEYLPGLYISTGHGSRGLCSCFISGEVIASMITAEPAPLEKSVVDYLNPARFIIRRLKRGRRRTRPV